MIRLPDWLNPWSANRRLRVENRALRIERDAYELALHQSNERYDRIRAANAELRETLGLYRNRETD